jgi:hypothetical protein
MSKLVDQPSSIAPFGSLLVPELQRVARNVQFEEIRDEALKALSSLTKALGDHYTATSLAQVQQQEAALATNNIGTSDEKQTQQPSTKQKHDAEKSAAVAAAAAAEAAATAVTSAIGEELLRENEIVEQEQERIRLEREAEAARLEEIRLKEEEERKRFKEAMDAQRELDKIHLEDVKQKKAAEELAREKQRLSTKSTKGTCQGCGLKKCKKTCMFAK